MQTSGTSIRSAAEARDLREELVGVERRGDQLVEPGHRAQPLRASPGRAIEPRVGDGHGRLVGEAHGQAHRVRVEGVSPLAVHGHGPQHLAARPDRHAHERGGAGEVRRGRMLGQLPLVARGVRQHDGLAGPRHRAAEARAQLDALVRHDGRGAGRRARAHQPSALEHPEPGLALKDRRRRLDDAAEHDREIQVAGEAPRDLDQRGELAAPILGLAVQPGARHGHRRLGRERGQELDLALREVVGPVEVLDQHALHGLLADDGDGQVGARRLRLDEVAGVVPVAECGVHRAVARPHGPALGERAAGDALSRAEQEALRELGIQVEPSAERETLPDRIPSVDAGRVAGEERDRLAGDRDPGCGPGRGWRRLGR